MQVVDFVIDDAGRVVHLGGVEDGARNQLGLGCDGLIEPELMHDRADGVP